MKSARPGARRGKARPARPTALALEPAPRARLAPDLQKYFAACDEKLGFLPNVLAAYSFDQAKLRGFIDFYNELMFGESGLSKLEREMVAVVVSAANRCYYCQVAHGQAVRQLSGDPVLGEQLVMNFRAARLPKRQRAMLDFAWKLTVAPAEVVEDDRAALRKAGLKDREIWDLASVAAFFNFSNRIATAVDMQPNPQYHAADR